MSKTRGVDFKNPKDIKEYVERIGIEYAYGCEKVAFYN